MVSYCKVILKNIKIIKSGYMSIGLVLSVIGILELTLSNLVFINWIKRFLVFGGSEN